MTLSLILFLLTVIFAVVVMNSPRFSHLLPTEYKILKSISTKKWFENPWLSGLFLFSINAVYFGLTGLILFLLMFLMVPYIHLVIMLSAVIISILTWMAISQVWDGKKSDRWIMSLVGSSFYALLGAFFFWGFLNVEPVYPGEDTFMRAIGWLIGTGVAVVAFFTCLSLTIFTQRKSFQV